MGGDVAATVVVVAVRCSGGGGDSNSGGGDTVSGVRCAFLRFWSSTRSCMDEAVTQPCVVSYVQALPADVILTYIFLQGDCCCCCTVDVDVDVDVDEDAIENRR